MIRSMTGYGRAQSMINGMEIAVEIKSVNHRYFEFSARYPRAFGFLEEKIKSYVASRVSRGKVDCYVSVNIIESAGINVLVNHPLAEGYVNALRELSDKYHLDGDIKAFQIAKYPDVLTVTKSEIDEDEIWQAVLPVAEEAVSAFVKMRENEGERLKTDILARGDTILETVSVIEKRSPESVAAFRQKIEAKMKELLGDVQIDEQRLLTETAIFADKIAVDEETVRLRSHIEELHSMMESKEAIGRKLDFLVQEINRETNTIGSKIQDVTVSRMVVDIKSEIEKIREQIQNIE